MNEHGRVYLGSSDLPHSIPWYFGQFERPVLLAALTLLEQIPFVSGDHLDSATAILRVLASKICAGPNNRDGIFRTLVDARPFSATENGYVSSAAILNHYLQSNNQASSNGTIWQQAAVLCSLCRSLGIPSRLVTIYNALREREGNENSNAQSSTRVMSNAETTRSVSDLVSDRSGIQFCSLVVLGIYGSNVGCVGLICQSKTRDGRPWIHPLFQMERVWSNALRLFAVTTSCLLGTRRLGPCSVAALKSATLDLKWDTPAMYSVLHGSPPRSSLGSNGATNSMRKNQHFGQWNERSSFPDDIFSLL